MHSIRKTSLEAYRTLRQSLTNRQQSVYEALESLGRADNQQIAQYLGWPINCVCGRVLELRKIGCVVEAGIARNANGNRVHLWRLAQYQGTLF